MRETSNWLPWGIPPPSITVLRMLSIYFLIWFLLLALNTIKAFTALFKLYPLQSYAIPFTKRSFVWAYGVLWKSFWSAYARILCKTRRSRSGLTTWSLCNLAWICTILASAYLLQAAVFIWYVQLVLGLPGLCVLHAWNVHFSMQNVFYSRCAKTNWQRMAYWLVWGLFEFRLVLTRMAGKVRGNAPTIWL